MTEVAIRPPTAEVSLSAPGTPAALVEWAHAAQAAHQLADAICRTAFCPDSFRGKPGEATAAILAGSELGLSPMAALNSFDVIQGRPAPKAITLRALAQSHGHDLWPVKMSASECVMHGRRRGSSEVVPVTWTIQRARELGLTNKPNWKNQPQAMLVARATSECARLIAADVLLGIPYSAEELADLEPEPTTTVQRAPQGAPKRTVRRAEPPPAPPPVDDPPLDDETEAAPAPVDSETISPAQLKKLHAALREQGLTDRDDALAYISSVLDRDVTSSKELTKHEASLVIDQLKETAAAVPAVDGWPEVPEIKR
jgi:hypothetical protein